jgi:hypothetical protein
MHQRRTSNHGAAFVLALLALMFTLSLSSGLIAQENAPAIPEQAKKLQMFVGTWEGTGSMTMGDMKHDIKITHINEPIADGWGFKNTEINEMDGMKAYRGNSLFGYDAGGGKVHMYTVSNYGDCHDHAGNWTGENSLRLQYDGIQDGKPMTEVINITADSPTKYHFTGNVKVDGKQMSSLEGTMTKK